jgi:hypothetical protein
MSGSRRARWVPMLLATLTLLGAAACDGNTPSAVTARDEPIETSAPATAPTTSVPASRPASSKPAVVAPHSARPTTAPPATVRPTTPPPTRKPAPKPVALSTCGAAANPWGYNFCGRGSVIADPPDAFCDYFACIPSFWEHTNGYVMQCDDLMFSHSGGVSGSCSHHQGNKRALYG